MPNLFYAGQPDYIEKLNTLATAASMTNGTVAASFLSLAVTGTATAASFVGPLTGNASTATTLATARNINGVAFNGSADITVTAAAGTLTGTTMAASVVNASLNSITPTGGALSVSGSISATGTAALRAINATSDYTALQMGTASTVYGQIGWGTGGEVVYNAAAGATRQHVFQVSGSNRLVVDANGATVTGSISATTRVNYPSFTVATLPAVGSAGGNIYVSDESGGAQPAFSDGTNWRRYTDRAVVS